MKKVMIQQGDVVLKRINKLPEGKIHVIKKDKDLTLALGEVTGHHHTIMESLGGKIVSLDSLPGKRFLMLESQAVLTHQEHNPVTLEPGIYSFGQVVEYDYFTEATKQVRD